VDVSCIVLAGGESLRMGRDKASEIIDSESLLQRVVSCPSLFCDAIILVTSGAGRSFKPNCPRLTMAIDIYPGKGPLGGIYTGLAVSDSFRNLVVACDMPFLNQALLQYMVRISTGFDLVIPRLGSMVEPLHAVYSKGCMTPIECLLRQGRMKVSELLNLVKVRYVEADEIEWFDPEHLSFTNVNTRDDLKKAKEVLKSKSAS